MLQPSWREVVQDLKVPATPESGIWTLAIEYVTGPRKFKILAKGIWHISNQSDCGADGDTFSTDVLDKCLISSASRGSLIGKVGGGTADRTGYMFPIGRITTIEVADPTATPTGPVRGALFLTMNDEPSKFRGHEGNLLVTIWEAS